jgi:hypothetical protein
MSKYEKPIPMSVLARRLAGAALAATLIREHLSPVPCWFL